MVSFQTLVLIPSGCRDRNSHEHGDSVYRLQNKNTQSEYSYEDIVRIHNRDMSALISKK